MEKYVLLNLAHSGRCPRRPEGAAARILGVFTSFESLRKHTLEHYADTVDVLSIPLRKWAAVLTKTDSGRDELQHLDLLGKRNREAAARHEAEFRENVQLQRTGEVRRAPEPCAAASGAPPPRGSGTGRGTEDGGDNRGSLTEAPSVPRAAELRQQSFAVISILPDTSRDDAADQEPALLVWDVYETEEAARGAIKDSLAVVARDVHLDVVVMYEWLPLTGLSMADVAEEFRDESLSQIIQTRKSEGKRVDEYRTLCEQRGQEPSVLDITAAEQPLRLPEPLEKQSALPNLTDSSCSGHGEDEEGQGEARRVDTKEDAASATPI